MLCRKCNNTGTLAVRNLYIFCDNCFLSNITHKFRACIGKNTKLIKNEKALICLSGGISSTVLLDLIIHGIALDTHKKLRITPIFLHITGIQTEDDNLSDVIVNQCKRYNVDPHIINVSEFNQAGYSDILKIHQYFGKLSSTTKHDYLAKLRQNIFYKVAKEQECNIIFTAETITKLSEKLLSNIVMGQGQQIENDVSFCDARDCDIKIYRPMRDITKEELQHYCRIKNLNPIHSEKSLETSSLQSVISRFILDLEKNTPATISTICKTADKIGAEEKHGKNKYCSICKSVIAMKPTRLTAVDAIAFSKMVSTGHTLEGDLLFSQMNDSHCYSCNKNYSELKLLQDLQ